MLNTGTSNQCFIKGSTCHSRKFVLKLVPSTIYNYSVSHTVNFAKNTKLIAQQVYRLLPSKLLTATHQVYIAKFIKPEVVNPSCVEWEFIRFQAPTT